MGQRGKTNGAPGSHALLGAKHLEVIGDFIFLRLIVNLHHEIGEAVDDGDDEFDDGDDDDYHVKEVNLHHEIGEAVDDGDGDVDDGDVDDGDDDGYHVEEIKPPS